MTLNVTPLTDQPAAPGDWAYSYQPDQLVAGGHNMITQPIVLASGTLTRGTVLGEQTVFSEVAVAGTNTGNGTIGTITAGAAVEYSTPYTFTATSSTVFAVTDPKGVSLGNATVGTAFTSSEINATITAGGTAFVAGDSFTVTFSPGIGNFIASVRTANDGSQNPSAILADNADASGGPVRTAAYVSGEFNAARITADSSWSLGQLTQAMRAYGIHLKSSVTAADPLF